MAFDTKFLIGGSPCSGTSILARILNQIQGCIVTQGVNIYGLDINTAKKCSLIHDPVKYIENISWRFANFNTPPESREYLYPFFSTVSDQSPKIHNPKALSIQIYRKLFSYLYNSDAGEILREAHQIHMNSSSARELSQKLKRQFFPKKMVGIIQATRNLLHPHNDISGDKLPPYGYVADELLDLHLGVKFIFNIRHPLSVCRSFLDPDKPPEWWRTSDPDDAFRNMLEVFTQLKRTIEEVGEEYQDQTYVNRVEDFANETEASLARVIKFLSPGAISKIKFFPHIIFTKSLSKMANYSPAFEHVNSKFNYSDHDDFQVIRKSRSFQTGCQTREKYEELCHFFGYEPSPPLKEDLRVPEINLRGSWD